MSTTAIGGSTMVDRMIRAAKLEDAVYEEVEHDQSATVQAFWVVVIASVAAGIGGLAAGLTGLAASLVLRFSYGRFLNLSVQRLKESLEAAPASPQA